MNQVSQLSATCAALNSHNRKVENDVQVLQGELEDSLNEIKSASDKASSASSDAANLANELRVAQDHATSAEKARNHSASQLRDLEARLQEARNHSASQLR